MRRRGGGLEGMKEEVVLRVEMGVGIASIDEGEKGEEEHQWMI